MSLPSLTDLAVLLLLQSYCPSSPSCHVATPLLAGCTPSLSPPSHMAMLPPPPRMCHIATCLACTPLLHTLQLHSHITAPLQLHTLPCCCPHMSPSLQPHTPHRHTPHSMAMSLPPSQSHMLRHHVPCCCIGHLAPLAAAHAVSLY